MQKDVLIRLLEREINQEYPSLINYITTNGANQDKRRISILSEVFNLALTAVKEAGLLVIKGNEPFSESKQDELISFPQNNKQMIYLTNQNILVLNTSFDAGSMFHSAHWITLHTQQHSPSLLEHAATLSLFFDISQQGEHLYLVPAWCGALWLQHNPSLMFPLLIDPLTLNHPPLSDMPDWVSPALNLIGRIYPAGIAAEQKLIEEAKRHQSTQAGYNQA